MHQPANASSKMEASLEVILSPMRFWLSTDCEWSSAIYATDPFAVPAAGFTRRQPVDPHRSTHLYVVRCTHGHRSSRGGPQSVGEGCRFRSGRCAPRVPCLYLLRAAEPRALVLQRE